MVAEHHGLSCYSALMLHRSITKDTRDNCCTAMCVDMLVMSFLAVGLEMRLFVAECEWSERSKVRSNSRLNKRVVAARF